jgi:hypothetical protein
MQRVQQEMSQYILHTQFRYIIDGYGFIEDDYICDKCHTVKK